MARAAGRFYPESSQEATAVLESAAARAWARGAKASGIVVDAPRGLVAQVMARPATTVQIPARVTVTQIVSVSLCCPAANAALLAAVSPEVSSYVSR
jgi:hypothetical protein